MVFLKLWFGLLVRYRLSRRHGLECSAFSFVGDLLLGSPLRFYHLSFYLVKVDAVLAKLSWPLGEALPALSGGPIRAFLRPCYPVSIPSDQTSIGTAAIAIRCFQTTHREVIMKLTTIAVTCILALSGPFALAHGKRHHSTRHHASRCAGGPNGTAGGPTTVSGTGPSTYGGNIPGAPGCARQ